MGNGCSASKHRKRVFKELANAKTENGTIVDIKTAVSDIGVKLANSYSASNIVTTSESVVSNNVHASQTTDPSKLGTFELAMTSNEDVTVVPKVTVESALLNESYDSVGGQEEASEMPVWGEAKLQQPAPQFSGTAVVNYEFKQISLADYKGKYVVLFFYPADFTFVCPTEIIAFSDRAEEFRSIGCEVIGASTDSHFSHFAWISTPRSQGGLGNMDIPLLADKNGDIAKAYGIYKEDEGIAFRGLFIIDGEQKLRQVTMNDLPVGRSVDETLRLVQAFQFTDKYGEVCPAGWKPGQKTIKPDMTGSKEYFEGQ